MPKTYNTISSVATGDVLTATAWNNQATNVNNYRVPPSCMVFRSSDLTSYTSDAAIAWNAEAWDTDDMYTAATSTTNVVIQTAGIYSVTLYGYARATATISRVLTRIKVNGTSITGKDEVVVSGVVAPLAVTVTESFVVGDIITATAQIIGGSAYIIDGAARPNEEATRLTVAWLGQVS